MARHFAKRLALLTLQVYRNLMDAVDRLQSLADNLFSIISSFAGEEIALWVNNQRLHLEYILLVATYYKLLHSGDPEAYRVGSAYLESLRYSDKVSLASKSDRLNIAFLVEDEEVVQDTLGTISDDENLPDSSALDEIVSTHATKFIDHFKARRIYALPIPKLCRSFLRTHCL